MLLKWHLRLWHPRFATFRGSATTRGIAVMMKTVWVAVISIGLSLAVNAGEVYESASSTEGVGGAADQQLATAEGEDKKIAVNTKDKLKCEPTRITGSNLRKKVCLTE